MHSNSLATIVSNMSRYTSITPVLNAFHWLPVEHHSQFITVTHVYNFVHTSSAECYAPCHFFFLFCLQYQQRSKEMVVEISLLFQRSILLLISLSNNLVGFAFDAPTVWNAFQYEICASFRNQLKSYLYTKAYIL